MKGFLTVINDLGQFMSDAKTYTDDEVAALERTIERACTGEIGCLAILCGDTMQYFSGDILKKSIISFTEVKTL